MTPSSASRFAMALGSQRFSSAAPFNAFHQIGPLLDQTRLGFLVGDPDRVRIVGILNGIDANIGRPGSSRLRHDFGEGADHRRQAQPAATAHEASRTRIRAPIRLACRVSTTRQTASVIEVTCFMFLYLSSLSVDRQFPPGKQQRSSSNFRAWLMDITSLQQLPPEGILPICRPSHLRPNIGQAGAGSASDVGISNGSNA